MTDTESEYEESDCDDDDDELSAIETETEEEDESESEASVASESESDNEAAESKKSSSRGHFIFARDRNGHKSSIFADMDRAPFVCSKCNGELILHCHRDERGPWEYGDPWYFSHKAKTDNCDGGKSALKGKSSEREQAKCIIAENLKRCEFHGQRCSGWAHNRDCRQREFRIEMMNVDGIKAEIDKSVSWFRRNKMRHYTVDIGAMVDGELIGVIEVRRRSHVNPSKAAEIRKRCKLYEIDARTVVSALKKAKGERNLRLKCYRPDSWTCRNCQRCQEELDAYKGESKKRKRESDSDNDDEPVAHRFKGPSESKEAEEQRKQRNIATVRAQLDEREKVRLQQEEAEKEAVRPVEYLCDLCSWRRETYGGDIVCAQSELIKGSQSDPIEV